MSPTFHNKNKYVIKGHLRKIVEQKDVELANMTQNKTTFLDEIGQKSDESFVRLMDYVSD